MDRELEAEEGWRRGVQEVAKSSLQLPEERKVWTVLLGTDDRMFRNGTELCQGRLRLDVRRNFVPVRMVKHWSSLPSEMVGATHLLAIMRLLGNAFNNVL